jgi:hypothetical protein
VFIQVIQGRCSDPAGLQRQMDRWEQEVKPGAEGYLGSTSGVADDGTFIALARFESEDAARRNSDRPEQGAWWEEASKFLEGVTFHDCTEVDTFGRGGSDDAGFVQVMQYQVKDRRRLKAMEDEMMPQMEQMRPDVIGSVRAWDGDLATDAIYFTSEAEAREGESKMAADMDESMDEWQSVMGDATYLDLKDPWLRPGR